MGLQRDVLEEQIRTKNVKGAEELANSIGVSWASKGHYEEAIEVFMKGLSIAPDSLKLKTNMVQSSVFANPSSGGYL